MTDDKGLVDAYSSIYKKEDGQLDEALPLIPIAAKAAMAVAKGGKIAGGLAKAAKVANKVGAVSDAVGSVADTANKIRGKGQHHPSQNEEVEFDESVGTAVDKTLSAAGEIADTAIKFPAKAVGYVKGLKKGIKKAARKGETKANEEVEGGVSVVDYNSDYTPTEIETVDVIPTPKMKGTEDLHEEDEALEERLWDQVAANLTTLGEMRGVKYQVSPFEEVVEEKEDDEDDDKKDKKKKDKTKNKDEKWQDSDGDGKWYEKGEDVKEGFNVKSPVVFSKKEEEVVDPSVLEEKCASSIKKAHKAIKK